MANNFSFSEGTGKTGAAKDIGGVLHPQVIVVEEDGTDTGLSAKLGSLTETAPATDTASSGLNGRLQRIAQRLTSLIALVPAALTGSGNFKVSLQESNASQAVTGTFWQATQPVSVADGSDVTIGAKADAKSTATDTTAVSAMSVWKQISASVQAIASAIAGTLTISGTVTANLAAGTNNIGDVDVLTLPADPLGANADAAATAGSTGTISAKLRTATQQLEDIKTSVQTIDNAISGNEVQVDIVTSALPSGASTLAEQQSQTTHLATIAGDTTDIETAVELLDDVVKTDDATFTPGTDKVAMAGFQADESSTDSIDEGDAGAARMTLDRKQIVTPQPHTAGGLSIFRSIDLDETEEDIKTSAGCIYGMWITNTATSTRFVKFYNATAANVVVGTTTPVITIGIPGNSSDDVSGLFASTHGIMFDTAISAAATTGVADNDTGAPGANEVIINVFYK